MTSDAYSVAAPEPKGLWVAAAMPFAVKDAGLNPEDLGTPMPNIARAVNIEAAISNSFGFGGQNGVLVFSKFLP